MGTDLASGPLGTGQCVVSAVGPGQGVRVTFGASNGVSCTMTTNGSLSVNVVGLNPTTVCCM
jgi:hypothetical protein